MGEYLVSRLSRDTSKVLFALLLVRKPEVVLFDQEFATLVGLPEQVVRDSLHKIEQAQLAVIIAQESTTEQIGAEDGSVDNATATVVHDAVVLGLADAEANGAVQAGVSEAAARPTSATASFVAALQELWDEVFPESEYPYQRLTKETARMWIRKYGDDFVREVLIDVRHTTSKKIEAPRGYVNTVLESQWEKKSAPANSRSEITDEMRELLRIGGRQLREQRENSGRGI